MAVKLRTVIIRWVKHVSYMQYQENGMLLTVAVYVHVIVINLYTVSITGIKIGRHFYQLQRSCVLIRYIFKGMKISQ